MEEKKLSPQEDIWAEATQWMETYEEAPDLSSQSSSGSSTGDEGPGEQVDGEDLGQFPDRLERSLLPLRISDASEGSCKKARHYVV